MAYISLFLSLVVIVVSVKSLIDNLEFRRFLKWHAELSERWRLEDEDAARR